MISEGPFSVNMKELAENLRLHDRGWKNGDQSLKKKNCTNFNELQQDQREVWIEQKNLATLIAEVTDQTLNLEQNPDDC